MICWAPLLSGSLCQRRDRNGRCPAHGKIVQRDRLTGRPVNIEDRKLLQEEMASIRMARQKGDWFHKISNVDVRRRVL
ncbi:unnamed protein product, partial [Trichobilharzia regenti]